MIQTGLSDIMDEFIFVFFEFRSVKINSKLFKFKNLSKVFGSSIVGITNLLDCSDDSIITLLNLSLLIFLTTVLSKIIGKNFVTPSSVAF